jgi:hypothetical protein
VECFPSLFIQLSCYLLNFNYASGGVNKTQKSLSL